MKKRRQIWDKRYKEGDKHRNKEPSQLLTDWTPNLPPGKALDVACGAGRNAIHLAKKGYSVDAIDFSEEALKIARRRAKKENVKVNWILADLDKYEFAKEKYDLVVVSYFHHQGRLSDIKKTLKHGGFIVYEHHINTTDPMDHGPKDSKYRFEPNELLNSFSDFQVLDYQEGVGLDDAKSKSAVAKIVVRKTKTPKSNLPPLVHEKS